MIRSSTLAVLVVLSLLAITRPAVAVKYMTLAEAVTAFIGADAKPFKVSRKVTAEERARLLRDYGWQAEEEYSFYLGKDAAGQPVAYVLVVSERFNTCFHKYAIGLKPDGEVIDTVVVELSCPRSFPINSKGFLKQFRGKRHGDPLTTRADIDAVSGATLSSESTAQATRKAVSLHNLWFGGAQPVKSDDKVRAARAGGAAGIQKAIDTGETTSPSSAKP